MKDALTTGEAAKYCGVNFRTVIRWIEKGYIKAYKLPGRGDNRIPIPELVKFMESNSMPIPEELQSGPSGESELSADVTDKQKVLIIEDEELMAKSIARTLARAGYEIEHAYNGIEAGIKLETYKPTIITLDLQMPGMSGFEVLEVIRANEKYKHIKVLVISAATKVKIAEVMNLGVDGVLEKPFKNEELKAALTKIVSS